MEQPSVSVIIFYTSTQRLDECLADLAQQTIINQMDIIPVFINENVQAEGENSFTNRAAASNYAISEACGDYIIQLDQDDRLRYDALEIFLAQFAEYPDTSVVFANVLTSSMRMKSFNPASVSDGFRWGEASIEKLEQFNCVGPHPCWRKSLHQQYGLLNTDHPNLALWEFWLKVFASNKFAYLDDVFSFTVHPPARKINGVNEKLAEIDIRNAHFANKLSAPLNNPLITVIIATRDRLSLLKIAVQSLVNQTWQNWEAIIINDGGEPIEKILSHFEYDKRIRIINNPESIERSASRNIGIENAEGEYLCFLDDDDILYRHHLELGLKMMSHTEEQCQILYFGANGSAGKLVNGEVEINQLRVAYNEPFNRERFLTVNYIPLQALIYKSEVFDSGERFDETMNCMEDLDLLIRLSQQYTFTHVPLITSEIRYLKQLSNKDLKSHIASLSALYKRYSVFTKDCWDIHWKQEQWLRGLKLDVARIEATLPTVSVILPPVNNAQKLMTLVDEIITQTRYGNYELILTATNQEHNLQQFVSSLPVKCQLQQMPVDANIQQCFNAASKKAIGEFIAVLAPDSAPATGHWLGELVEAVNKHSADFASAVVLDRKDGFLINELCLVKSVTSDVDALEGLYSNHSLFSPWLRSIRQIEIPSLGVILFSREDYSNTGGLIEKRSLAFALAELSCRLRIKENKCLKVNPFAVMYSNTERAREKDFDIADYPQLSAAWGDSCCRTDADYYIEDKLWNRDNSSNNYIPAYQDLEPVILQQASELKKRGKMFEAMLMMEPLLRIFPESLKLFDTLKSYLSEYNDSGTR